MSFAFGKFIGSVVDSIMLFVTQIHKAIIASPVIGMDYTFWGYSTTDNLLQRGFGAIRNDLSVYFASSLQDAENGSFPEAPRPRLPLIRLAPK